MSVNPNIYEAAENTMAFVQQGVERLTQFQKTMLDNVSQQSVEANQKLRESFKGTLEVIVQLNEKAASGCFEAQKSAANVIAQTSTEIAQAAKDRGEVVSKSIAAWDDIVQRAIATENTLLDFAAKQHKAVIEAIHRQAA
jgi:gas vesicle protein